jgi:cellulose synthase/poly-beta-1,6-N-acetylglucosamine synthase-like glycosyltransferase
MYSTVVDRRSSNGRSPVATVIVPTRQRADLVVDTIEALFRQDIDVPFEIIVVDNASTDSTSAVLADLAARAPCDMLAIRMHRDGGPARSRNAGIALARGWCIAFTDSDCMPSEGWLRACVAEFDNGAGVVQGRTEAPPSAPRPFFSHFIETTRPDGSFSTSNVAYRGDILRAAGGFDSGCDYWEDVDLGWRVVSAGARDAFAPNAVVYHQVIKQAPVAWLMHARRFANWPAKAARYRGFRRYLFLRVWVEPFHVLVSLAAAGIVGSRLNRRYALLALPYVVAFPLRHGLSGRFPPLKAAAHVVRDFFSFGALVVGSIRHRSVVL